MSFSADYAVATYVPPSWRTSGATFAQLQALGLAGVLEKLITAQVAISAPATPTAASPTGSDGLLAAGVYYCKSTNVNGYGESVASTESSSFTISSTNHVVITLGALPTGVGSRNLYLTAADGASGSETLYATGITGTTYTATKAGWSGAATPPTADTTALAGTPLWLLRMPEQGNMQHIWTRLSAAVDAYVRGNPVAFDELRVRLVHIEAVVAGYAQLLKEINTLVAANPGQVTGGTRVFS